MKREKPTIARSIPRPCILLVALLRAVSGSVAATTILDFEDANIPTNAIIDAQYGARGVIFQHASLEPDSAAHSGARVLRSIKTGTEYFGPPLPFVITFTSAQARVKFFAGSQGTSLNGTLTAFDSESGGNVVATDGPRLVPQDTFTTTFEVKLSTASIRRVEFQLQDTAFESIDDLEFDGEPPPPPPPPPVVTITQPVDGINVDIPGDIPKLDIAGTVTGDGLLPHVTVTMAFNRPPESATLPPLTLELDLTGSGTTRQFSLPNGMSNVPLGPVIVTATAQNTGGLTGSATSTFTNLPLAVRDRFTTEGGAAVFGEFQYGILGACSIAVYENGAISGRSGGATVIRGDIFTKWLSLRGPFNETGWFGCPLNEEGDTIGGARSQPFERGRIYAHLPGTAPPEAFYVPLVFTDAIDKRGGDAGIGLPLADPTNSAGVMQTWLFQRFARPNDTDGLLPSTMEIRGSPPTLWMERQAGSWMEPETGIGSAMDLSDFDRATHKGGATLWESFTCNDNLGPCTVDPEPPFPPPNMPNAGDLFCNGALYIPTLEGDCFDGAPFCHEGPCCIPPEWHAIRGDYIATPVFGVIVSAFMDNIDNGFTHQTHNGNCPYFPNILEALSTVTCASDYEFFVRPIGPQVDTSPLPSLFGKSNTENIKTEYEVAYAAAAHNFLGAPTAGDLVHMTGRWIIDCGHKSYKSELHPLFSFARMKTVVSETNTFTGLEEDLFGGKPATRVAIWINGWYPGGEDNAIEFDAFPPPRLSPTAVLHIVKPVDSAAGGFTAAEDVTLSFAFAPAGAASHAHLRFTSPRRENPVTSAGEMLFGPGRQYWGIWYLYWGE